MTDSLARIRDHAYHCFPKGDRLGRAIRTERYRLVEWKPRTGASAATEYELYDYQNDPFETKSLAESNPDVLAQLKQLLATHPAPQPVHSDRQK